MEKKNGREIVLTGHTLSAPYEVSFTTNDSIYVYGANFKIIQACIYIDKKCKNTGKKALAFIKDKAEYCLKYKDSKWRRL